MSKFIVINDGGDGDISWGVADTHEDAIEELDKESYYAILEVDFHEQTIKRIGPYCQ